MNNPNPLIPQGSLLEQQAKGKPHLRIALFIVAVHVVFLGLLLMQGCKRETDTPELVENDTNDYGLGSLDRSTLFASNSVLDLPLAQEPDMNGPETAGGFIEGDDERAGTMPPTTEGLLTPPAGTMEPAPVPALTPERQLVTREHEVVSGDTFYEIGKKYGVTTVAIAAANPNVDPLRMRVGQKLIIPPPVTVAPGPAESLPAGVELYEVRSGDTLTRIARTRGTTAKAISELNGMTTDRIYVGQKLKLPARTNAGSSTVNP
jgi:LysM repeat protein